MQQKTHFRRYLLWLAFSCLISSSLFLACQKRFEVASETRAVADSKMVNALKDTLKVASSVFQPGGRFFATIGEKKNILLAGGAWQFDKAVDASTNKFHAIEVPALFSNGKNFIDENGLSNGVEPGTITYPSLVYFEAKDRSKHGIFVVLRTLSVPLSSVVRRQFEYKTAKRREVFYDLAGKLLTDSDIIGTARTFFSLKNLDALAQSGRVMVHGGLTCSMTETKDVSCTNAGGNNTVCTFIIRRLMRCTRVNSPDPLDPTGFLEFLEEGDVGGAGGGELIFEDVVFQNQNIIDSLTGFPCAQSVLASVGRLEDEVSSKIKSAFQVNPKIRLQYSPDRTLVGTATNGEYQGSNSDTSGNTVFFIGINPDILQTGTREFIYSVFMHEALHAWFRYERGRLGDSAFKVIYPNVQGVSGVEARDHHYFSTVFIGGLQNSIRVFNPTIDSVTSRALAWRGLHTTSAWAALPPDSQAVYSVIWWRERNVTDTVTHGKYRGSKCQ